MDWFTEKFVEDCIAEAPRVFLDRNLELKEQQPKLGNFRPDLLFQDEKQNYVIIEVQRSALDRYHLYKCVEYRDLLFAREGNKLPHVILVCESMPPRYDTILVTHGIELLLFSPPEFAAKAIASCPKTMSKHLLKNADELTIKPSAASIPPLDVMLGEVATNCSTY